MELYNVSEAKLPYLGTSIVTSRKYMADNPAIVENFMKAILEAIVLIKNDPEGTKEVLAKYLNLDPVADAESTAGNL